MTTASPSAKSVQTDVSPKNPLPWFLTRSGNQTVGPQNEKNGSEEIGKLRKLEQAGIKIRPASHRNDCRFGLACLPLWGILLCVEVFVFVLGVAGFRCMVISLYVAPLPH